jgi:hypothetical protein
LSPQGAGQGKVRFCAKRPIRNANPSVMQVKVENLIEDRFVRFLDENGNRGPL